MGKYCWETCYTFFTDSAQTTIQQGNTNFLWLFVVHSCSLMDLNYLMPIQHQCRIIIYVNIIWIYWCMRVFVIKHRFMSVLMTNEILRELECVLEGYPIMQEPPGPRLNIKTVFIRFGIHMLKIRRSRDRLILNMGIPILVRLHIYIETPPHPGYNSINASAVQNWAVLHDKTQ